MRNATRVFHLQTRSASFTARPRSPLAIKSSSSIFFFKLRGRRADDGRRRRRGARSEAEFLRLTLSRFFSRSNHDTLFPAPPPPESGASRASLAGDVKVLRRDRDRRRERILLRRARRRARVRVAAAERRPWRGTSFSPHSRAARLSRRARTRLLTNATTPTLFRRNRAPRPLARTRRVRVNRTRPTR